ncbi:hypothetical protein KQI38_08650 [Tissierella carlieri]|jgi:hypothetical protein|nr:hypothetical protein [Tissierella carlieri]
MNFLSYFRVEVNRIFRSKITWFIIALSVLVPLGGYNLSGPVPPLTTASRFIANPVLIGALGGAILFALLTLFELNKVHKNLTAELTDTIVSPHILNIARLFGVIVSATVAVLVATIVYLPYTVLKMGDIFNLKIYLNSYFILMLPSLWISILAMATFYQIIHRTDLSFVLFIVFFLLSTSRWFADDYILRWVNPLVPILSDDFSNAQVFRMASYNRLFWFSILIGIWLLSMLCVRRYGKGLLGSLIRNGRRIYIPLLSVTLIIGGYYMYVNQPYVDHSPLDWQNIDTSLNINEEFTKLALKDTSIDINFNTKRGTLSGTAIYHIQNENTVSPKCRLGINPGYTIKQITANGEEVTFSDLNNDTNNFKYVIFELPPEKDIELSIDYGGMHQIWSVVVSTFGGSHIGDNYIDLGGKDLAPILEIPSSEEGGQITGRFTIPENLNLIATGDTVKLLSENDDGTKTWLAHDTGSRLSIFAGDYVKLEIDGGNMPVEFYYSSKHQKVMEKMDAQNIMEHTIAYCTDHYGPLLFATPGYPFKIIQSSAFLFGGGAIKNCSFMGEIYFSDENLNNKQHGASSGEVLSHEIAHQWWGLSAQSMDMENLDWTDEGVTVYTTYRIAKEKFGAEYAQKNYVEVWKQEVKDQKNNFYNRHPEYLDILPEKYAARLYSSNTGTNMYSVMPLTIYKAAELVGGEERMDEILAELYQNGGTEMPPYITYNDFLEACGLRKEELILD